MLKKKIFTILMSLAMVITMMPMMAGVVFADSTAPQKGDDFTVGNLSYTVIDNECGVVVRKADNLKASELTGTVVVPEVVTYAGIPYTVKEVQDFAFKNCMNIKSMVLGMSKKAHLKIGRQSFRNCTGLRNFTTGTCDLEFVAKGCTDAFEGVGTESNPCWFNKIDTGLYAGYSEDMEDSNKILRALKVQTINTSDGWLGHKLNPKTLAFEDSGAYFVCTNLYSLYSYDEHKADLWSVCIPNAESSADADDTYTLVYGGYGKAINGTEGKYYFPEFAKISKVIIPETVGIENIGDTAFAGLGSECGIDEIILPSTVWEIGHKAFIESGIKSVVFDEDMYKMGDYVFAGCSKLQKVTFKSTPYFGDYEKGLGADTFADMNSTPTLVLPLNWSAAKYNSTNWYGGKFKQYINPAKKPKVTVKKYSKSFKLSWKKVSGASYYVVQTAKKGKTLKSVVKTTKRTYTVKKVAGKSLKKGKKYSMRVLAYDYYGNLIGRGYTLTRKK